MRYTCPELCTPETKSVLMLGPCYSKIFRTIHSPQYYLWNKFAYVSNMQYYTPLLILMKDKLTICVTSNRQRCQIVLKR